MNARRFKRLVKGRGFPSSFVDLMNEALSEIERLGSISAAAPLALFNTATGVHFRMLGEAGGTKLTLVRCLDQANNTSVIDGVKVDPETLEDVEPEEIVSEISFLGNTPDHRRVTLWRGVALPDDIVCVAEIGGLNFAVGTGWTCLRGSPQTDIGPGDAGLFDVLTTTAFGSASVGLMVRNMYASTTMSEGTIWWVVYNDFTNEWEAITGECPEEASPAS